MTPMDSHPVGTEKPRGDDDSERGKEDVYRQETVSHRQRHRRGFIWALAFIAFSHVFMKKIVPYIHNEVARYRDDRDIPIPDGIVLGRCANWTRSSLHDISGAHKDGAEFHIDIQAPQLFISQGALSTGEIIVTQSKKVSLMEKATVNIGVTMQDRKFLEYIQVCEIKYGGDADKSQPGIGIFSVPWRPRQQGWFSVSVQLPRVPGSEGPLNVSSLTSRMPNFSHMFRNVQNVQFEHLEVSDANRPINAQSLFGRRIHVKSLNAPIRGNFNAIETVTLETAKSSMDVSLGLHDMSLPCGWNCPGEWTMPDRSLWPQAVLRNKNGRIHATTRLTRTFDPGVVSHQNDILATPNGQASKAHLYTTNDNADEIIREGGRFAIDAKTTRGPIEINFEETPLKPKLHINAVTSFNNVKVSLPTTYEGLWKMRALFPSRRDIIDYRGEYTDPSGEKRDRALWVDRDNLFVTEGALVWGRREDLAKKLEGSVELKARFGRTTIAV